MLAARQLRALSFFNAKSIRMFSFDYSALEEPALKLEDDAIKQDNHLFTIVHRNNTLPDLIRFYSTESSNLPLLHHSIFLNKVCNVAQKHQGSLT